LNHQLVFSFSKIGSDMSQLSVIKYLITASLCENLLHQYKFRVRVAVESVTLIA